METDHHNKTPVLADASPKARSGGGVWPLVAALGLVVIAPGFMCLCGHLGAWTLLATAPASVLSIRCLRRPRPTLVWRGLSYAAFIAAMYLLLKNLADVLLLGHEPLLAW